MRARTSLLLIVPLLLTACWGPEPVERHGPLYFEVEFTEEPDGLLEAEPAPFSTDPISYRVKVTAIGPDHEPMTDWDGVVAVRATPGALRSSESLPVSGGVLEATVQVALAFDQLRIWFSDEGDGDQEGSYAAGVAPIVYVMKPTVSHVQTVLGAGDESPLTHSYVPIRAMHDEDDPRQLIVTTITNDGFYVTDFNDPAGTYNSLFAFSFSRPDGLAVGDRLGLLSGIISEFIGFTEMQFPTWIVESSGHPEGDTVYELDSTIVCNDFEMEAWEASPIEVVQLVPDFRNAADCADYFDYGQWPAKLVGAECGGQPARVSVVNINTVPSYGFADECNNQVLVNENMSAERVEEFTGATTFVDGYGFETLRGVVRHTAPANPPWIIDVRNCLDFPEARRPADCGQLLERPMSGPRKGPQKNYRDLQTCHGVPYKLY
jgi:hypothetical protein